MWKSGRGLEPGALLPMIDALAHRGPEGAGWWLSDDRRVLFLHARLAFVDVGGGIQPMASEDGAVWLTFNGEIYGYKQATRRLEERGHRFRTRCDAEVVPHLFEDHGAASFAMLRGEFAFALYDGRRRDLYLVRDRFGVKPLHYCLTGDSIVFGSEAKAVLSHPAVEARLDGAHLARSLIGLGLPDESLFAGIRQVRPGHYLKVSAAGLSEVPYWTLRIAPVERYRSLAEAGERFRDVIDEAVRLRLEADVEVGTYLSGGLDSSTLVESFARQSGAPVKTFTIRFAGEPGDEAATAAAVARRLGAVNIPVEAGGRDLAENFPASLWHSEQVAMNSHGTAKFLLSAECHRHVKAVLTGEGADDLFAGYAMFSHQHLIEARRRGEDVAQGFKSLLGRRHMLPGLAYAERYLKPGLVTGLFGTYPYQALRAIVAERLMRPLLSPELAAGLSLEDELARLARWLPAERLSGLDPVRASQAAWLACELPSYLLSSLGDRPEMAHSVEGRLPFLDTEVADFALALPSALLADTGNGKLVVREAMRGRLPEAVTAERKRIFWVPPRREDAILAGEACRAVLAMGAVKEAGLFDHRKIAFARGLLKVVPGASRIGMALRLLLIATASAQLVHHLFIERFADSRRRYACRDRRWTLEDLARQPPQRVAATV